MPDSTAPQERAGDVAGLALVRGESGSAERALRSVIQALEGKEGGYLELETALVKLGALKQETGNYGEAEAIFEKALEVGERVWGPNNPGILPAMAGLGAARMLGGSPEGVDALLRRALEMSESPFGEDHPDLVILLNDLARLCLKQSAHAFAEPLLLRLLAIKQNKGEEHPEVGTVLASLAAVRQALGRHESAEQLWRRVLAIRERTLAPNHFALATALEHLADSCAARGKLAEALSLYQRGQAIREATLGVDHASLRISRERVADLQLQASEDFLDPHCSAGLRTPADSVRLLPAERQNLPDIAQPTRERFTDVPAWSAMAAVEREPATEASGLPLARAESSDLVLAESEAASYRGILLSMQQELEPTDEPRASWGDRAAAIFAPVVSFVRRRQKEAAIVAAAMIILLLAIASDSRAWSEPDQQAPGSAIGDDIPLATGASFAKTAERVAVDRAVGSNESASAGTGTPATHAKARAVAPPTPARRVSDKRHQPAIAAAPVLPRPIKVDVNMESAVRAIAASTRNLDASLPVEVAPSGGATLRSSFSDDEKYSAGVRARLIGAMPIPRYPLDALDVEGEVRVRVEVGPDGRPIIPTLTVIKSPHTSLTSAVRNAIAGMRFEPARSGGAQPRAISEIVEMGFRFGRNAK